MRQRIVIELEGEEPVIENMIVMLRKTAAKEAMGYDNARLRGFSILSKIIPEEVSEEIQVPEFINQAHSSIRQSDGEADSGAGRREAVQNG